MTLLTKVRKILENSINKDNVIIDDNLIITPLGDFIVEKNKVLFSMDATFCDNIFDFQCLLCLMNILYIKKINVEIYELFFTIFNDDNICVGIILDSNIRNEAKKLGIDYFSAKGILSGRLIDEYNKNKEEIE